MCILASPWRSCGTPSSRFTMEIYTQVSDEQTRAALRKLGDSLDG
jgi:hypothetical protein